MVQTGLTLLLFALLIITTNLARFPAIRKLGTHIRDSHLTIYSKVKTLILEKKRKPSINVEETSLRIPRHFEASGNNVLPTQLYRATPKSAARDKIPNTPDQKSPPDTPAKMPQAQPELKKVCVRKFVDYGSMSGMEADRLFFGFNSTWRSGYSAN